MLLTQRKPPNRYLSNLFWDLLLAAAAAVLHLGLVPLEHPLVSWLAKAPDWLWPLLVAIFLLDAVRSIFLHRRLRGR